MGGDNSHNALKWVPSMYNSLITYLIHSQICRRLRPIRRTTRCPLSLQANFTMAVGKHYKVFSNDCYYSYQRF